MLVDELKDMTAIAMENRADWSEENEEIYHQRMVINRLKAQAKEGFHMAQFPYLSEAEVKMLKEEGLTVTERERKCTCLHGGGWFIDWFPEGGLERLQDAIDEFVEDEVV